MQSDPGRAEPKTLPHNLETGCSNEKQYYSLDKSNLQSTYLKIESVGRNSILLPTG
jgi:hypothetical protein